MARFEVINSSPGVYWIHDTVGDPRWTQGMGLTFGSQTDDEQAARNSQALANQTCLVLNLLAPGPGPQIAAHESPEDFVNRAGMQIKFQSGFIARHGQNGVFLEDVLEVAIKRLRYLNGKQACRENSVALTHLETGLLWLGKRAADRKAQGVHDTEAVHAN